LALDLVSRSASAKVAIANRLGLHARPAMMFVEAAMKFKAEITVRRMDSEETIDGKSIMQMMMLAATQGTELEIVARHDDCEEAVKELVALVRSKFQEE
jgi:phosphocarrier protein HPr